MRYLVGSSASMQAGPCEDFIMSPGEIIGLDQVFAPNMSLTIHPNFRDKMQVNPMVQTSLVRYQITAGPFIVMFVGMILEIPL